MRSILTAGLLVGTILVSPALAQDKPYDATTVLATVNGTEITLGHVIALRDQLPTQYQEIPDEVMMSGLIDQLVDQELLVESKSASEETDPLLVQLLVENQRRGALAGLAAEATIVDVVDDAKVQAAYDEMTASFESAPEFNASHILVDSEDKAAELKEAIDGGTDFGEAARENSSDGSAADGGSFGWFGLGQMVPEFETAVSGMEVGQVSEPVQTQFGWHLIKLNETRETTPPALDQIRPDIESQLRQEALQARLEELRAAASIDRPEIDMPPAAIRERDLLTN